MLLEASMRTVIDDIESKPNPVIGLLWKLPKFGFYLLVTGSLLYVVIEVSEIGARTQDTPVLVQTGTDGKPLLAVEVHAGTRTRQNIDAFIREIMPMLMRMSRTIPKELGGGADQGITPAEVGVKIPQIPYAASFATTEDYRVPLLQELARHFPKGIWTGEEKVLQIINLDPPVKTQDGYRVFMTASLYPSDSDGNPLPPEKFNRDIYLVPVARPKFVLSPTKLELLVNGVRQRGLAISLIAPRKEPGQ
jgi:hypothetical protein